MKKLVTLLAAAGMVVASSAPASAADVKLDGFYRYSFQTESTGFQGMNKEQTMQRFRLGMTITASENLKGYTQFQVGTSYWGDSAKHGKKDVQSRQYYIDWKVPGAPVQVRMGRQALGLPADSFGGNNFLGAAWGPRDGIVVSAKATDWLSVSALWARAAEGLGTDKVTSSTSHDLGTDENLDVFGLAAKLKFDGITVEPWVAYASMGAGQHEHNGFTNSDVAGTNDQYESDTYAFGATATMTFFDPFKLVVSAAYAAREYDATVAEAEDREGYSIDAKASYKLGFGTPFVAAWYTSGDDAEDQKNGNYRGGWMPGINSYSSPTATFFDGSTSLSAGVDRYTTLGTWGAQLGIEGMSFVKDLTHTATVTWIQGTNNTNGATDAVKALGADGVDAPAYAYMTTADSVVELALTTDYKIYKNLTATLELAYLISDFDENVWQNADGSAMYDEDDWRVGLTFTYKF